MNLLQAMFLAILAASATAVKEHAPSPIVSIQTPQPITLETATHFWRFGTGREDNRGLMLRVRVRNPMVFLPAALPPPIFMLGRSPCQLLRSPLEDGEALLLCPPPAAEDPLVLWVIAAVHPQKLSQEVTERALRAIQAPGVNTAAPVPAERLPPRSFHDVSELLKSMQPERQK